MRAGGFAQATSDATVLFKTNVTFDESATGDPRHVHP